MHISLPPKLKSQWFLQFLNSLEQAEGEPEIILDFADLRLITPGPLAALTATIVRWRREHKTVHVENLEKSPIIGYLQRMDFLKLIGVEMEENFIRKDGRGRFVPVHLVDHAVDGLAADMAQCLAPGGDDYEHPMVHLYDFAWYVITETGNNVRQHSRGLGYATAQVTGFDGMIRLSIADNGKGILKSFHDAGLPWSQGMTDEEAIKKALEPRVSSKFGPNNEGVGLTLVSLLTRLTGGWLVVLSGTGMVTISRGGDLQSRTLDSGARYRGTIVALAVDKAKIGEYAELLNRAKIEAGLLQSGGFRAIFE